MKLRLFKRCHYLYQKILKIQRVIRNHKQKKDRQYNGHKKTNEQETIYKTLHRLSNKYPIENQE